MSTIKTKNIAHPSATTSAITLNADGSMGGSFPYPNRNLLYNGAMQVHQRGTSTTGITTTGYYTADRWRHPIASLGTWTQTVENDAPTGSGLSKSLKVLCTSADAAPAASDSFQIQQALEGQDLQRIAKGTVSAQQLTLSFWVKSNVTGAYIARLVDFDNSRAVSASYTISASATWEKKTITFPADTTGVLDNDNGESFRMQFWLGAGSDFTSGTLNTTWASNVAANSAVGGTNLAAATNNYWQVTGVQLEVGPVATPFQFKSFGQELAECQRYYYRNTADQSTSQFAAWSPALSTTAVECFIPLPVSMRTTPTSGGGGILALQIYGGGGLISVTSPGIEPSISSRNTLLFRAAVASGLTTGTLYRLLANSSTSAFIECSAEF